MPSARATARIFASGPTSTGTIRPRFAASIAPSSESRSHGCTTAQVTGGSALAALEELREPVVAAQDQLRRRDVGVGDALGRRRDRRHAVDQHVAVLVRAAAVEIDAVSVRVLAPSP